MKAALRRHHFYELGGQIDGREFQVSQQYGAKTTVTGIAGERWARLRRLQVERVADVSQALRVGEVGQSDAKQRLVTAGSKLSADHAVIADRDAFENARLRAILIKLAHRGRQSELSSSGKIQVRRRDGLADAPLACIKRDKLARRVDLLEVAAVPPVISPALPTTR